MDVIGMSSFETGFLIFVAIAATVITVRTVWRIRRINRAGLLREPGTVMTDPVHGAWTPGRPGQAARFYTGEAAAHGTNAYGDGSQRF